MSKIYGITLSTKYKLSGKKSYVMDVVVDTTNGVENYQTAYQTIQDFKKNNPEYKGVKIVRNNEKVVRKALGI